MNNGRYHKLLLLIPALCILRERVKFLRIMLPKAVIFAPYLSVSIKSTSKQGQLQSKNNNYASVWQKKSCDTRVPAVKFFFFDS